MLEIDVSAPREPIAQPPDQLQKMDSTRTLEAGDFTVTHSSLSMEEASCISIWALNFQFHAFLWKAKLTGDFDIVNPDIRAPYINTVQASFVATADNHIVDFAIRARVQRQVERRRVHQRNVVHTEIRHIIQPQDPGAVLVIFMELVPVPLDGASRGGAVKLKVGRVFNVDHVAAGGARAVNGSFQVDRDARPAVQGDPVLEAVAARGNVHLAAGLACGPGRGDRGRVVGRGRGGAAIVEDVADIFVGLGRGRGRGSHCPGKLASDEREEGEQEGGEVHLDGRVTMTVKWNKMDGQPERERREEIEKKKKTIPTDVLLL